MDIVLFWVINIVLDIISGIFAWNIIEPESFGGAIGFLVLWGIFGFIAYYLSILIMGVISGDFKKKNY